MALIVSAATGNFNAGATWVGGVVPTIGDEARSSNGHTITISASATCDEISNAGTGIFALSDGVTLRANITNKTTTHSRSCLQFAAATGFIEGNCTGGPTLACVGVINTGSGTLYITGNCVGGSGGSGGINIGSRAVSNDSTGAVVITGNCTGGSGGSSTHSHGAQNSSTGSLAITGNVTGGALSSNGVYNHVNGTVTITGTCTGGTSTTASGLLNASTGTVTITGRAIGGTSVSAGIGVQNSSTGNVFLTRAAGNGFGPGSTGLSAAVGLANAGLGLVEIQQLEYGSNGMSPTSGTGIRLKKLGSNVAVFNFCDTVGAKTLIDATQNAAMPAATDVRSGVSYASGALTGTCAVPSPATVATGVPVDNTFGTAALSASDVATAVWAAATRTITGGLVDTATTLTNAPTVPSVVQIRQEMDSNSTKLANLDATVSSRLAPSALHSVAPP